jgi:hypothetical protein
MSCNKIGIQIQQLFTPSFHILNGIVCNSKIVEVFNIENHYCIIASFP